MSLGWGGGHSFSLPPVPIPRPLRAAEDGISLLLAPVVMPPGLSLMSIALTETTTQRGLGRRRLFGL